MLTTIREKVQGIVAAILLVLVGIPFALWGTYSYFEGGSEPIVAKVDGTKITQQAFHDAIESYQGRVPSATFGSAEFKQQVLDQLIDQAVLLHAIRDEGLRVSDTQLGEFIRSLPYLRQQGHFDPELYQLFLRRQDESAPQFESRVRQSLLMEQLGSAFSDSVIVPDSAVQAMLRLMLEKRAIQYVVVDPQRYTKAIKVSDAEIQSYYATHKDQFLTQEQVKISYLTLSATGLGASYHPTERELRDLYQQQIGRFSLPEKRRVSDILIALPQDASPAEQEKAKQRIAVIETKLHAGASFSALARQYSDDRTSAERGGDLGDVTPGMLGEPLDSAVFALKPGQVSAPLRGPGGYHLLKVTAIKPGSRRPFAAVRQDLVTLARQQKGQDLFDQDYDRFNNLIYEHANSLEPAANAFGLKVQETGWFTRNGGAGIAAQPKVIATAFNPDFIEQGYNSDAIDLGSSSLVAIRISGYRPAREKPLQEVRDQIVQTIRLQKGEQEAVDRGQALVQALRQGGGLPRLARQDGLSMREPAPFTQAQAKGLDPMLVEAVFQAGQPQAGRPVVGSVNLGPKGYAVFAITRIIPGDPATADAALKTQIANTLRARWGVDYFKAYIAELRRHADVKVYADRM